MNKEFIPYEQALELKELGFDERCMAIYFIPTKEFCFNREVNEYTKEVRVYAPLYQQAFRWFREKYGLCGLIGWSKIGRASYSIFDDEFDYEERKVFDTYEEAELACLKKLIEIAKNK